MASAANDSGFEELFVRVVPVEVCCTHHSSNGGGGSNSGGGGSNVNMPAAKNIHHCLRAQAAASHASERFYPDSPSHASAAAAAGAPMPGTPPNPGAGGLNPSGLYPTLSSAEMQTCFCPNCCSNTYTAADGFSFNGRPESSTLQSGPSSADGGMAAAAVAVQRITVRVLAQKSRYGANGRLLPGCFKMELSSDSSLFFLFLCTITEGAFQDIKEACDLSLTFQQLPGLLLQLLDLLVRQPSTYLARLMMQQDGTAAMEFAQTLGFKTLSLLVLPRLEPAPASMVRGYVTARHTAVLERCAALDAELADLKALVRQRCPNLLIQVNKSSLHHNGHRMDVM